MRLRYQPELRTHVSDSASSAQDTSDGTLLRNRVLRKEYELSNGNVSLSREMFPLSFCRTYTRPVDRGPRVLKTEGLISDQFSCAEEPAEGVGYF